jgi:hypothetical protein
MSETNGELVLCPGSHEAFAAVFLDKERLHRVPQAELDSHRGLCKKCFEKVQRNNCRVLAGKVETPVELSVPYHNLNPEEDHSGYVAPGEAVQTVDFNYDEIDRLLGLVESEPPTVRATAAALFAEIMAWVWSGKYPFKSAAIKFAALTAGLRPDLLGDRTFLQLGREYGVTKAAISKAALKFSDAFGIQFTRSRTESARNHMAVQAIGHKRTNTGKPSTQCHPPPA